MKKKYLDKLLENKIFTQQEYDDIMQKMHLNKNGELIGVVPKEYYVTKYNLNGDMLRGNLTDFVKKHIIPPYEAADLAPEFNKYGMMVCGICDYWHWFTKDNITKYAIRNGHSPIEEATEFELWKMIATTSRYWQVMYQRLYREKMGYGW